MSGTIFMMMAAGGVAEQPVDGQTGVWLKAGAVTLSSAMKMTGAVVSSGQKQYVYSKGVAVSSFIPIYGNVSAISGGVVSGCVISGAPNAGVLTILTGGTATDCTLINGDLRVNGYPTAASALRVTVLGGRTQVANLVYLSGWIVSAGSAGVVSHTQSMFNMSYFGGSGFVRSGGFASGVVVHNGATFVASNAGIVHDLTISSGGSLTVSSGGTALAVASHTGAIITVADGGYIEYAVPIDGSRGVWLKEGATVISSAMTMTNVTVTSGQILNVWNQGVAVDATAPEAGIITVRSGGIVSGGSAGGAGYYVAYSGGILSGIVLSSGGSVFGYGGVVSGATVSSGARLRLVSSGSIGNDIAVERAGYLYVSAGCNASAVIVASTANLVVESGGTALAVTSNAGAYVNVHSGGYIEYVN